MLTKLFLAASLIVAGGSMASALPVPCGDANVLREQLGNNSKEKLIIRMVSLWNGLELPSEVWASQEGTFSIITILPKEKTNGMEIGCLVWVGKGWPANY